MTSGSQCLTAKDLGAVCDGVADDGAILTAAIAARFGTLATNTSQTIYEIDFGDGSLTYNLNSPILVEQNYIRLVGQGARLQCNNIANAVIGDVANSGNNLFGLIVKGFAIYGNVMNDAIVIRSASQCEVDVRNKGVVAEAVVHFVGTLSSRAVAYCDSEGGAVCKHIYRESVLQKAGQFYNCINNTAHVLSYYSTGAGVFISESDGFRITGDIEQSAGPGIDLLNSRIGFVAVYTEANGQGASNTGTDTADDIRIRSAPGALVSRSVGITILGSSLGGELVNGVIPTNVHVISADGVCINSNSVGGKIVLESDAEQTHVGAQARLLNPVVDGGSNTVNLTFGREVFKANYFERLVIDARAAGGAKIGSEDSLLRLYGISGISMGKNLANNLAGYIDVGGSSSSGIINLSNPEVDANYIPLLSLWDIAGGAATKSVIITGRSASSISFRLDTAPGSGQTVRVHWMIIRTT